MATSHWRERSQAVTYWGDAAALRPDNVETLLRYAQALMRDDRKEAAAVQARRILTLRPDDANAKTLLDALKAR